MKVVEELRKINIFENLNESELKLLSSFCVRKSYSKGEIVFYEKDTPSSLLVITEGVLRVYKTNPKGNEIIINKFYPTSLVAEMPLLEDILYPASAAFESDGMMIEIDFSRFKKEFLQNPEVSFLFFKSLSEKIRNLENVIALNVVLDSTSRVAKYICENKDALTMKHSEIAQYLDMTPETLSRIFKKLLTLGLVEKKNSTYTIINAKGLRVLFE
jgi:CRP/FNR family transcriptional regulator